MEWEGSSYDPEEWVPYECPSCESGGLYFAWPDRWVCDECLCAFEDEEGEVPASPPTLNNESVGNQ